MSLRELDILSIGDRLHQVKVLDITSKPRSPCVNTAPRVNEGDKVKEMFLSKMKATKGLLFDVKVPDELFLDWVRNCLFYKHCDIIAANPNMVTYMKRIGKFFCDKNFQSYLPDVLTTLRKLIHLRKEL